MTSASGVPVGAMSQLLADLIERRTEDGKYLVQLIDWKAVRTWWLQEAATSDLP